MTVHGQKIRITLFVAVILPCLAVATIRKYTIDDVFKFREEVRDMFQHAYDSYLHHAYPYDELRPLSCDGVDTWGSYSLTLIDALDTLAVIGNFSEFRRVVKILTKKQNFDANINVSVFETNIRIVGGLLSAHLLSHRAGVELEPGWPCNGPLLRLAEDVGKRLLPAFDTPTGMPYGTVNLRYGVPPEETTITCTAGIGTFILEFGTLSRLTGDPVYEEVAMNALHALRHYRSSIGLVGNHIDVATGKWTALDSGIGAGVDSYYEYLAKGAVLLQQPSLMKMFEESRAAIDRHLKKDDWHLWVTMTKGQVTLPVFQSLDAYWPGVLSIVGDISSGMKSLHNYHQVWKQFGFTPEFYNIPQAEVGTNREGYPLRPELAESVMYLSRATGDPFLLEVGVDILRSIQHSARTPCGYATIKDTRDHRQDNRMESFFLAETTKYLYLLFDPDNFIHNRGQHGSIVKTHWGECIMEAGGYVFNTEAHPFDAGALHCCSKTKDHPFILDLDSFRGETLHTHQKREDMKRRVDKLRREKQVLEQKLKLLTEKKEAIVQLTKSLSAVTNVPRASNLVLKESALTPEKVEEKTEHFNVGHGQVVEVKWHGSVESDNVWHTKAESETVKQVSKSSKSSEDIGTNVVVSYQTEGKDTKENFDDEDIIHSDEKLETALENVPLFDREGDDNEKVSVTNEPITKPPVAPWAPAKSAPALQEPPGLPDVSGVSSLLEALDSLFTIQKKADAPEKKPFDPQDLLMKIRYNPQYFVNSSWINAYECLSCDLQPFLQRWSMSGEFFTT